jgi:DNA polymerase-2
VKKLNATQTDIQTLIQAVNEKTNLKLEYKHSFSRMVFLPSIVNTKRPVPGRFYGIGTDGKLKLRGIEARQKSQPWIIRHMQKEVLQHMAQFHRHTPIELFRESIPILRTHLEALSHVLPEHLAFTVCLGKTEYQTNGPQKQILNQLKRQGKKLRPGQSIQYIIVDGKKGKYVEMNQFQGKYDEEKYEQLMRKAYLNLFLPLHVTLEEIEDLLEGKKQMRLVDFAIETIEIKHTYLIH